MIEEPFTEPCAYCTGNSSVRKLNDELMTSEEWCAETKVCAVTIDWEEVYGR